MQIIFGSKKYKEMIHNLPSISVIGENIKAYKLACDKHGTCFCKIISCIKCSLIIAITLIFGLYVYRYKHEMLFLFLLSVVFVAVFQLPLHQFCHALTRLQKVRFICFFPHIEGNFGALISICISETEVYPVINQLLFLLLPQLTFTILPLVLAFVFPAYQITFIYPALINVVLGFQDIARAVQLITKTGCKGAVIGNYTFLQLDRHTPMNLHLAKKHRNGKVDISHWSVLGNTIKNVKAL